MKKDTTVLILCALILLADALCLQMTFDFRRNLEVFVFGAILFAEILLIFLLFWLGVLILRKRISPPKKGVRSPPIPTILQPLGR